MSMKEFETLVSDVCVWHEADGDCGKATVGGAIFCPLHQAKAFATEQNLRHAQRIVAQHRQQRQHQAAARPVRRVFASQRPVPSAQERQAAADSWVAAFQRAKQLYGWR